ncbi:hypothetical protein [Nocardioides alkalitolerans]|uniref:hypothetical protein n=1 Tax=Nocardioides alkalitolerans TaxID=281714 RepID=UPI0003F96969|nr:hypothetical protein [Nocardioides alkalitolerans]
MPFTPNGIWYPDGQEGGDPVRGAPDFEQLAKSVDAAISQSVVESGAAAGGWAATVTVQKSGRLVTIAGGVRPYLGHPTTTYVTAAYLPEGHRPMANVATQAAPVFNSTINYSFVFQPDGHIRVRISGALTGDPMPTLVFPPSSWLTAEPGIPAGVPA